MKEIYIIGKHPAVEAIKAGKRDIKAIFVVDKNFAFFKDVISLHNIKLLKSLKKVTGEFLSGLIQVDSNHQGVVILASKKSDILLEEYLEKNHLNSNNVLILDKVLDPHNIGAIIRTAVAFDFGGIIMQDKFSPDETTIMNKASSGGIENINLIKVTNISTTIERLKKAGYWIVGLDGTENTAKPIQDIPKFAKVAIVAGAEGLGIRPLVLKHCDIVCKIDINEKMESLNVSNAVAICLHQFSLKRD